MIPSVASGLAPAALAFAAVLAASVPAVAAEPPLVAVVRQPDADPVMVEVSNRTQAELSASGFGAIMKDCARSAPDCLLLMANPASVRFASVATFRDGDETVTEVRFTASGSTVVRRVSIPRDNGELDEAPVLAIRAVELVRATLLQTETAVSAPAPSVSLVVDAPQTGSPSPAVTAAVGWSIGGGGALLESAHGFSAAYALLLRAGYRAESGLSGALVLAGPGFTFDQSLRSGAVRVRQELVALELAYSFRRSAPIQPRLTVACGAHHIEVRPNDATMPSEASAFTVLASAGVGVLAIMGKYVALFFDAHAIFTEPNAEDLLRGGPPIRIGSPSLLMSLGIQRTF